MTEFATGGALSTGPDFGLTRRAWRDVIPYARSHPLFMVGLVIVGTSLLLAVVGPAIGPYDPEVADPNAVLSPPSAQHWFGTDESGLDVFSRVIAAPRVDVSIAVVASLLSLCVGSAVGLLISYFEGPVGEIAMRSADVVQAFPLFVLAMVLAVIAGRSYVSLVFIIAFLNAPIFLRLMRSQVLALKRRSFAEAARAVGDRELVIAYRHILPNALEPGFIQTSVTMGFAIILTAGLSFLGAGVRPPTPEWGSMIASGASSISIDIWWPSVFPGVAMSVAVFGFATVGEGLRDFLRNR